MRPDDQPRPDLDAAIDAVVPALTEVSHEAATDSLRRTRVALSDARGEASARPWRWRAAGAVALTIVLVALAMWRRPETPAIDIASTRRPSAPAATAPRTPMPVPSPAAPQIAKATPAARLAPRATQRVRATSAPRPEPVRRPDPLAALVAAVQAIPEDAWARGAAAPDVTVAPIAIAPLETPAIPDAPAEPIAPGEP